MKTKSLSEMGWEVDESTEAREAFYEDSREKKAIARGVHNRAPRKSGLRRPVMMPVDYLRGKERKNYMAASEITKYSIYDDINNCPSYSAILAMSQEQRRETLEGFKEKFTYRDFVNYWGKPQGCVSYIFAKAGLTKPINRGPSANESKKKDEQKSKEAIPMAKSKPEPESTLPFTPEQLATISEIILAASENKASKKRSAISLELNIDESDKMTGEELQEVLTNFATMLLKYKYYKVSVIASEYKPPIDTAADKKAEDTI